VMWSVSIRGEGLCVMARGPNMAGRVSGGDLLTLHEQEVELLRWTARARPGLS
jgi:hypothetical protein